MEERIPPQDLEAEQSVLGALMLSKDAISNVAGRIKSDFFYRESHAYIYEAVLSLYRKNEPVDLVTVSAELKKANKLDAVGGRSYLAEVMHSLPTASNVEKYSNIVLEKALLRRLIDAGTTIVGDAFEDQQEVGQVLDSAQKAIMDISRESVQDDFVRLKEVLNVVFDNIQETYDKEDKILGIPTGFHDLDMMTSGFQPSDLVILAARPSVGKTTMALNFAAHAAIEKKIPVAIFSLEMPKEQLAMRLLCSEARIDSKRLRTANLLDHEYKNLNYAFGKLGDAPIYIDDTAGISPMELRAKSRRMMMEAGIKLIIIDYLQLMRSGKKRVESRFQEVSEIVRDVKGFAKESGIPIVALSQLSRDVEKRKGEPQLSDLRESGELEQTADLVMFLHRNDSHDMDESQIYGTDQIARNQTTAVDLKIAKQRNGPIGTIKLTFKPDISKFMLREPSHVVPQ
ncbi:replicative DNA helicase [Thermoproteota archaeon]